MKENDDDKEILAQDVFILGDTTFGACCVDEVIIIIIRIIFASIINVIKIIIVINYYMICDSGCSRPHEC